MPGSIKNSSKKTLWQYIISNIALILLAAALLIALMGLSFMRSMENESRAQQQRKLQLAAQDLAAQFEILQNISYHIGNTVYYQPSYYEQNAYYQRDMILDLEKFNGYSNIVESYFFFYQDEPWAYRGHAGGNGKLFLRTVLTQLEITDPEGAILRLTGEKDYVLYRESGQSRFLLSFPVRIGVTKIKGSFCFVLNDETILHRARVVSGMTDLTLNIEIGGQPLLAMTDRPDILRAQEKMFALSGFSRAEEFPNRFETYLYLEVALVLLIMIGMGIYVAYRNWRPLHRIAEKLTQDAPTDDLALLEQAISQYQQNEKIDRAQRSQFREQQKQVLRDIARLILDYPDSVNRNHYLESFEKIAGKMYYLPVLFLRLPARTSAWTEKMEALADESMTVTVFGWKDVDYAAMIINTDDPEIKNQFETWINEIGAVEGIALRAAYGDLTDSAADIPDAFCRLMTKLIRDGSVPFDTPSLRSFLDAVRKQSDPLLRSAAVRLSQEIKNRFPAQCFQKSCVSALAQDIRDQFPLCGITEGELAASFHLDTLENSVNALGQRLRPEINEASRQAQLILQTIREQYLQYDCSMDTISASLHISPRHISRILKSETGRSFKDYLIEFRIREACRLLRETDMTVVNIMEQCGYSSASHFFRCFAAQTGTTPSGYRKEYWSDQMKKHDSMSTSEAYAVPGKIDNDVKE